LGEAVAKAAGEVAAEGAGEAVAEAAGAAASAGAGKGENQVAMPRQRNFRLLVACNVISVTGSGFSNVAVPFAVLRIGGSAADVGFVGTASLVPLIACLLLGGVVADRISRHRVIVVANVVQTLAQGTAAALLVTGDARVWQLIVLVAAGGAALGFYLPASSGLLPQTVPTSDLARANAPSTGPAATPPRLVARRLAGSSRGPRDQAGPWPPMPSVSLSRARFARACGFPVGREREWRRVPG
jgi:hypothetical protein